MRIQNDVASAPPLFLSALPVLAQDREKAAEATRPRPRQNPSHALREPGLSFLGVGSPSHTFHLRHLKVALPMKGEALPPPPWPEKPLQRAHFKDIRNQLPPTAYPRQAGPPLAHHGKVPNLSFGFSSKGNHFQPTAQSSCPQRANPDGPDPPWYGGSIAHCDGDTLLVNRQHRPST